MTVSDALAARKSIRAFLDKPVPKDVLETLLETAQQAPSGGNLQPWKVICVTGTARDDVINLAQGRLSENPMGEPTDRPVYPPNLWAPFTERRREIGEVMYGALDIPREDKAARRQWFARNYQFFGAPVGLFFILDERMAHGQWAHTGMFMQSIALVATELGLGSCMQECWGILRPSLKEHFDLDANDMVYCGMALGYPDWDHPVNQIKSPRATLDEFAEFRD
ncbi:MAG: nitroreductase family protein [Ponticaulis sp.]|nr:nitroreductase family protein [Ponticaulis sp.]